MIKKLIRELRLISPALVIVCAIYVVIGALTFFLIGDRQDKYGGLSANIFAGSIDTLIAVILINFLIARTSHQQQRSLRLAAYVSLEQALRVFELTWREMVISCSRSYPAEGTDLLCNDIIAHVAAHMNLDALAGKVDVSWISAAAAAGQQMQGAIRQVTSRYALALEPAGLVACGQFEECILVRGLAELVANEIIFKQKGTTMQTPFRLGLAGTDPGKPAREFIALLNKMADEFKDEKRITRPVTFKMTAPSTTYAFSHGLGSAYVD